MARLWAHGLVVLIAAGFAFAAFWASVLYTRGQLPVLGETELVAPAHTPAAGSTSTPEPELTATVVASPPYRLGDTAATGKQWRFSTYPLDASKPITSHHASIFEASSPDQSTGSRTLSVDCSYGQLSVEVNLGDLDDGAVSDQALVTWRSDLAPLVSSETWHVDAGDFSTRALISGARAYELARILEGAHTFEVEVVMAFKAERYSSTFLLPPINSDGPVQHPVRRVLDACGAES